MPWSFRKTISFGPLRITFSKSGVSFSFGAKGVRTRVDSHGKRTTTVSIPGTGLSYRDTSSKKKEKKEE
jgi:hypothetical protein